METWGIDPGIRGCGKAVFQDGALCSALYVRNPTHKGNDINNILSMAVMLRSGAIAPLHLVAERPQVYREVKLKGDPNDLLPLLGVTSALAALLSAKAVLDGVTEYLPREWKGTVDPEVMTQRVRQRLTKEEFSLIDFPAATCDECRKQDGKRCQKSSCLAHNIFDAVGIALKSLGRLERNRVIAR